MRRSSLQRFAAAVLLMGLSGCSPYGPCLADLIDVTFDATVTADGTDQARDMSGRVTSTNLDPALYQQLVGALIDNSIDANGAVWTLDVGVSDGGGYLAIQLPADPAANAVLVVEGAFAGGGWGFLLPAPSGVRVAALIGTFSATAASGTLTVLSTQPLQLLADITVGDGSMTHRFQGIMQFARVLTEVACD